MRLVWIVSCVLLLRRGSAAADGDRWPEIRIQDGTVRGTYAVSSGGRQYASFEGIPYAKPPVGFLRFEEPQGASPWSGVLMSRRPSPCLQYPHRFDFSQPEIYGDEDCLYVNVYTPNTDENAKLDVIVHIHGGAFMMGESTIYGPDLLMDRDVVYVHFNYRLGPLGFLSTEDDVVPGNNGMKDQTMALRWIKNNVHHFGGNRDSITLTGLSAGGASVHYHYLSPTSRGLFERGVSMSGSALCPWTFSEANLDKAKKLAAAVGCPTDADTRTMVECMKQRPGHHIVAQVPLFMEWMYNPFSPFGVVVEKGGDRPFLSGHPHDLLKEGKAHDKPWLASVTDAEGLYPAGEFVRDYTTLLDLEASWPRLARFVLDYNYTVEPDRHEYVAERAKAFYLKGRPISEKTFDDLVQMIGDRMFVAGSVQAGRMQAKVNKSPVYFYHFRFRGEHSLTEWLSATDTDYGVSHADDAAYIMSGFIPLNDVDRPMVETMLDMWTSFAKNGHPIVKGVKWEPVCSKNEFAYLEIQHWNKMKMRSNERLGHTKFWTGLPINEKL